MAGALRPGGRLGPDRVFGAAILRQNFSILAVDAGADNFILAVQGGKSVVRDRMRIIEIERRNRVMADISCARDDSCSVISRRKVATFIHRERQAGKQQSHTGRQQHSEHLLAFDRGFVEKFHVTGETEESDAPLQDPAARFSQAVERTGFNSVRQSMLISGSGAEWTYRIHFLSGVCGPP